MESESEPQNHLWLNPLNSDTSANSPYFSTQFSTTILSLEGKVLKFSSVLALQTLSMLVLPYYIYLINDSKPSFIDQPINYAVTIAS